MGKGERLITDVIDLLFLRYGSEKHERLPCPLDTATARILWDLWQLYQQGAPLGEIEGVLNAACVIYGIPMPEAYAFVFEEHSIYGRLEFIG